ncbi:YjgN family protein [Enterovibrio nigricans]|uniref:Uncharacterized membrane protein YjgN, DUF898 family n=1 Tax=Enterovibrio nigricans DSM 22720 TaxID=1121868 RepID=A0A1T4UPR5_9GAMM|nr:YjgN family protein [Enterovibrio nigricans]PKF50369.1 DUF898 domain-containing protein [Enterovibrio nigricans]SKA54588.1 Uncharacterized membrane protein YjgN, DUF898 family [Enterovibrio nigricans DSM 22720]
MAPENKFTFHGSGREFFGIWIVNVVLSIITLGIYSAWAKVRTNKYFYGNTELASDRFDYHATPKQILIGRIIATIIFIAWFISGEISPTFSIVLMLVGMLAMPWLARNNVRFDAKMTSYRNVRLNFNGSLAGAYGYILGRGLIFATCIFAPIAFFAYFQTTGQGMPSGVWMAFVLVPILGFLSYVWLMQGMAKYFANGYGYGKLRFKADVSFGFFIKTYLLAALMGFGLTILGMIVFGVIAAIVGMGAYLQAMDVGSVEEALSGVGFAGALFGMVLMYASMFALLLIVTSFIAARTRNHVLGQMTAEDDPMYKLGSSMRTMSYMWLTLSNFLLLLVTLGIARPWVKVRTTRYLCSVTTVQGDIDALTVRDDMQNIKSSIGDELANSFDLDIGIG